MPTRRTLLLAAATAPVLAACGAADTQGPPAARPVTGKVLVLSYQTSSPRYDMQVSNYEEFNREFKPKGLEVEFVNPGVSVIEKVIPMHVAGTPADMWEWPRLWRELEGIIADIAPYFKRDRVDEKQWIPSSIETMKQAGKIWGMPVTISADATAYNLDLFEKAGLKPPPVDRDDKTWNMDTFLDYARKLTKGTEQFGMEGKFTGGPDWMIHPTFFGYGPVDLQAKKVTINTSGYQRGVQYWVDLQLRHKVWPTGAELNAIRAAPGQDSFLTGKVGMKGIFNLATKPEFRWGLATLPYTPSPAEPKNVSARISVHALFIDSESKNKDQAWEVFKYWQRPDTNQKYVLSNGHIVSPLVKTGSEATLKDFKDRMGVDAKAFVLQAQSSKVDGWGYYLLKDQGKARAEIDTHFTEVKAGRMTVNEFTQKAQQITEQMTSF